MTITRLLGQLDDGRLVLDPGWVVVCDESGMVGTRTLDRLSRHTTDAGAKLVLAGDTAQLPEIDAGGSFRALTVYAPSTVLVENRRQVHDWEIGALHDLRNARVPEAVAAYDTNDRIITADNTDALRQRLVDDWFAAPGTDKVMIATRRADVADLNDRARALLDDAGPLREPRPRRRRPHPGRRPGVRRWGPGPRGRAQPLGPRHPQRRRRHRHPHQPPPQDRDLPGRAGRRRAHHAHRPPRSRLSRSRLRPHQLQDPRAPPPTVLRVGGDGDLDRQAAYTALSRGRIENRLYLLTPDHDDLFDPNPAKPGREQLLDHTEHELSRRPLPTPRVGAPRHPPRTRPGRPHHDDLLELIPEPVARRTHATLADDLLAALPEPDPARSDLAERVAKITARLDHLQQRAVDDGFGIDL